MAVKEKTNGIASWTIVAGDGITSATFVPELGAIGSSLILPGPEGPRETLFQHEHFWDPDAELTRGGLPFLFPVCGRLERGGKEDAYCYDHRWYTMKIHGFAHRLPWNVLAADDPGELVLELNANELTSEQYPFSFTVRLTLRVEPGRLICEQEYHNRGDRPYPYYAGFHPYFLTPPPDGGKSDVRIELAPLRVLAYNSKLTDVIGVKSMQPAFPASISDPRINEQLLHMGKDKNVCLRFPDGFAIQMRAGGASDPDMFPYVQLYTMADKPFFCVEPWMGVPNALNTVDGVRRLAPGDAEAGRLLIAAQES